TGDAGFLDANGYLHFTGRISAMIKTGGANVSPAEVEAAALTFPGVRTAIALGMPDEALGEVVVLCVVAEDDRAIDDAALIAALRVKLASYKLPKRTLFLRDDEVPRTGTAKVRLGALRDLVARRSSTWE